jgi:hypothetical protein
MKKIIHILKVSGQKIFLSLHTTVICLIILCILVLWGTFYQIDHGIYAAKARFFSSWLVFIGGFFPFPGVRLTVLTLILNQVSLLIFRQKWRPNKAGLILTHTGILVLLIGGGIISYTSKETLLTLWEGESSNQSASYRDWELAVWAKTDKGGTQTPVVLGLDTLRAERAYAIPGLHAAIRIRRIYKNCMALMPAARGDSAHAMMAVIDSLEALGPAQDPSENMPGLVLAPESNGTPDGRICLYGGTPEPAAFAFNSDTLFCALRQKRTPLPLTITLINFVKEDYAGTQTARQFKSKIRVKGGGMDREVVISMNKPFRYKQFTFYQSSYSQGGGRQSSTLAVVENRGKSLPYVAGILMAAGLILHFFVKLIVHIRKQGKAA